VINSASSASGLAKARPFPALIVLLITLMISLGSASGAQANPFGNNFCTGTWLDRYGQPQDYCAAGLFGYNYMSEVKAHEHAACASFTNNSQKSGVYETWDCTPGWSSTQNWGPTTVFGQPIIRNNTTGSTNHADGYQLYCNTYACS
jgi:hypothetical protein